MCAVLKSKYVISNNYVYTLSTYSSLQVKVKPDYSVAHSNLGNAQQELGEMVEAEESYREALRLNRNHTLTKFRLAKLIIDLPTKTLARLLEADAMYVMHLAR